MFLSIKRLLILLWVCIGGMMSVAHAADFTAGADYANGNVTLWFKSQVSTTWVDAHYTLDSAAQQNVRMTWNASTSRYETNFGAKLGQSLKYSFTYNNGTPAYDSAATTIVISQASTAGLSGNDFTAGVEFSSTKGVIWLSPRSAPPGWMPITRWQAVTSKTYA